MPVTAFHLTVFGAHVTRREDIREEQHLLIPESGGNFDRTDIGNGTLTYSACPPENPPSMWEKPNRPAGEWPMALRATSAGIIPPYTWRSEPRWRWL